MSSWRNEIDWSKPRSLSELTDWGARDVIPEKRGYYAFMRGKNMPCKGKCLYLGRALSDGGLRQRLRSYLRAEVTLSDTEEMRHKGKRLLSLARIQGVTESGKSTVNTGRNDKFLHVCWTTVPVPKNREDAYMLEYALLHAFEPDYNTVDYKKKLSFKLKDQVRGRLFN